MKIGSIGLVRFVVGCGGGIGLVMCFGKFDMGIRIRLVGLGGLWGENWFGLVFVGEIDVYVGG